MMNCEWFFPQIKLVDSSTSETASSILHPSHLAVIRVFGMLSGKIIEIPCSSINLLKAGFKARSSNLNVMLFFERRRECDPDKIRVKKNNLPSSFINLDDSTYVTF